MTIPPTIASALRRAVSIAAFSSIIAACPLFGQEAEETADTESVVTLSPFEVSADTGWIATETLAGSRLKTDFKDVAAQVETMTMDFMDDFALNSVEEALIYSANVSSPEDRITGHGGGFGTSQIDNFSQIRGVGAGTNSREFFAASMPTDNYNLSRLTIASGPQSVLFGTGSPAGVLDVSLNRASVKKDGGSVEGQWDNFGSHRYVFDYNKVLIDDMLGVRVTALNEDRKQEWKPNYDKEERLYLTAFFKPFDGTTLSVHFEDSRREPNRVNRFLPFDRVQAWYTSGKPAFDNGLGASYSNIPDLFNRHNYYPTSIISADGSVSNPISYRNSVTVRSSQDLPGVSPLDIEADNWTITQPDLFPAALLNGNIAGLANFAEWEAEHTNIFFEQRLAKNWFVTAAYNREDLERLEWGAGNGSRGLNVDPNLYMQDGLTPNPNFGELYVENYGGISETERSRENWRIMMSYELDFTDRDNWLLKFIGRQRLGGLVSEDRYVTQGQQGVLYRALTNDAGVIPSFPASQEAIDNPGGRRWASDIDNRFSARQYLTAANGYYAVRPAMAFDGRPLTFQDEAGVSFTMNPLNPGFVDDGHRMVSNFGPTMSWQDQSTQQLSYQGFLWDGRLVLTYGYREDEAEGRDQASDTPGRSNDHGFFPYWRDVEWGDYREAQSGETSTRGIVARPLPWVSFFYSESDTWQPNVGRFNPFGDEYPGANGEGKDYGIRLDLLDNKLSIKWNEFDMTAGPTRAANTPFNRWRDPIWAVENRWRQLVETPTYPGQGEGGFRDRGRSGYWVVSDNTSKGTEITVQAIPIRNLNLRFTYTDREAMESNIGNDWFDWIDARLPVWQALNVPEGGYGTSTTLGDGTVVPGRDMNDDGTIGNWTWDTAWQNNNNPEGNPDDGNRTLAEYYDEITVNGPIGAAVIRALDGKPNEFDRSKRWNINASYRFSEGRFKGFTIGGAARWREAPVVGHGSTLVGSNENIDLTSPYHGAEDFKIDAFFRYRGKLKFLGDRGYSAQINVNNLLNQDDLFPVIKGINGGNLRYARSEGRRITFKFGIDL